MKFSKEYQQLLVTLPSDFQENAIDYRGLKKLIKRVVCELEALGLRREVLHDLLQTDGQPDTSTLGFDAENIAGVDRGRQPSRIIYELQGTSDQVAPRLRMKFPRRRLELQTIGGGGPESPLEDDSEESTSPPPRDQPIEDQKPKGLLWTLGQVTDKSGSTETPLQNGADQDEDLELESCLQAKALLPPPINTDYSSETVSPAIASASDVIIPLPSDAAFFDLLITALKMLSSVQDAAHVQFDSTLRALSRNISSVAIPTHSGQLSWRPNIEEDASFGSGKSLFSRKPGSTKSDLDQWRQIFQLYVESSIFESVREVDKGKMDVVESEKRLGEFARRVVNIGAGDGRNWKRKESQGALETFLELNVTILNIKKFQHANAEATRKILKKHEKMTALPTTSYDASLIPSLLSNSSDSTQSLSHVLLVELTETLLPVIPHIDDYLCLICTSLAFKPVRLDCSHLFCVRCLVKMQRAGQDHCPVCRAPVVLRARGVNLDHALMNFMLDWFPAETHEKSQLNIRERQQEDTEGCLIM